MNQHKIIQSKQIFGVNHQTIELFYLKTAAYHHNKIGNVFNTATATTTTNKQTVAMKSTITAETSSINQNIDHLDMMINEHNDDTTLNRICSSTILSAHSLQTINNPNQPPTNPKAPSVKSISATNSTNEDPRICRICYDGEIQHEDGQIEKPVYACRCRGSIGLVHLTCLQKWLTISQTARCELCHYQFPTKQILRYNKCKSISVWYKNIVDKGQLIFDLCAWLVMTPIIGILLWSMHWLCYELFRTKRIPISSYVIAFGVLTTAVLIVCYYATYTFTIVAYHYRTWWHFYTSDGNKCTILTPLKEPIVDEPRDIYNNFVVLSYT